MNTLSTLAPVTIGPTTATGVDPPSHSIVTIEQSPGQMRTEFRGAAADIAAPHIARGVGWGWIVGAIGVATTTVLIGSPAAHRRVRSAFGLAA